MVAIGDILSNVLHKNNDWKLVLVTNWSAIVGPLATRMRIEKIEQDTLVVGVCDSAWLQELSMLSTILVHKINQALPTPVIKKIRFKHANARAFFKKELPLKALQKAAPRPLSIKERGALQAINDQELSTVLHQFLLRCHQTNNH